MDHRVFIFRGKTFVLLGPLSPEDKGNTILLNVLGTIVQTQPRTLAPLVSTTNVQNSDLSNSRWIYIMFRLSVGIIDTVNIHP
jgi:hypothetical protein